VKGEYNVYPNPQHIIIPNNKEHTHIVIPNIKKRQEYTYINRKKRAKEKILRKITSILHI